MSEPGGGGFRRVRRRYGWPRCPCTTADAVRALVSKLQGDGTLARVAAAATGRTDLAPPAAALAAVPAAAEEAVGGDAELGAGDDFEEEAEEEQSAAKRRRASDEHGSAGSAGRGGGGGACGNGFFWILKNKPGSDWACHVHVNTNKFKGSYTGKAGVGILRLVE